MKLLAAMAFAFLCGTYSFARDEQVMFKMLNPILINADLTLSPGTQDEYVVLAPWALSGLTVNNSSEDEITVRNLTVHCTGDSFNLYTRNFVLNSVVGAKQVRGMARYLDAMSSDKSTVQTFECVALIDWTCSHKAHLSTVNFVTQ